MKRLLTILLVFMALSASAQKVAMKTNVLYDASATVNAGVEIGLAQQVIYLSLMLCTGYSECGSRNWACSAMDIGCFR